MASNEYGRTVSIEDVQLAEIPVPDEREQHTVDPYANPLWWYQQTGTINGIPVDPSAQNLPINKQDLLESALVLNRRPKSAIFWMSPDDKEAIEQYDKLLDDQFNGKILIVEETKQYDPNKSKFMVWVRYDELCYMLHPRFEYLREEIHE